MTLNNNGQISATDILKATHDANLKHNKGEEEPP